MHRTVSHDWRTDVSVIAGLVHQWLRVSDPGGRKVEWLLADHTGKNFLSCEPQPLFEFLDQSIKELLKIALQICTFFCIERAPVQAVLTVFGNLKKENYISFHKRAASDFALLLLHLLRYVNRVNNIKWPRRGTYRCNIMKESKNAMHSLLCQYVNLPYRCAIIDFDCPDKNLRSVKLYPKPAHISDTFMPTFGLPKRPQCSVGKGHAFTLCDDLTVCVHSREPSKIYLKIDDEERPYLFPTQRRSQPFSGSYVSDLQILEFLTPAELHRMKAVNKNMRMFIRRYFRVPTEWARMVTAKITSFFDFECGKTYLLLESWVQDTSVSKLG